jgi:hypothetical protein
MFGAFDAHSAEDAIAIDLKCFYSIIDPKRSNQDRLKKVALELFMKLDANDSGSVTEEEFVNCIETMYNKHLHLSMGLTTQAAATKAIEIVIAVIYVFVMVFVVLLVLEVNVWSFYTAMTTFFAVWGKFTRDFILLITLFSSALVVVLTLLLCYFPSHSFRSLLLHHEIR